MSKSASPTDKEERKRAILAVITGPEGFAVDLFGGSLTICRLEDGQYSVTLESSETLFAKAEDAIDHFLSVRKEYEFGYDYEAPGT